jgi:hypothetical protein
MTIGLIYFDAKPAGARSAGNLHAACDVAGAGNVLSKVARQLSTLPPMESFWGTLKNELVHHRKFRTRQQAVQEVTEYIEIFWV